MTEDVALILAAIPLFKTLEPTEVSGLCQRMTLKNFAGNQPLMVEGQPPPGLCVLLAGKVAVVRKQGAGVDHICDLDAGECVGELEIFERTPCSASVVAAGNVTAAIISEDALMQYFSAFPTAATKILWQMVNVLATRLRQSNVNYTSLKAITEGMLPE